MTIDQSRTEPTGQGRSWLWDHIGRLVGIVIVLIFLGFLLLLWIAGFPPAGALLVFLIVVFVMIALGGRLHGL